MTTAPDPALQRRLDGELRLAREAILLVAGGGAPRVLLAGLTLGGAILDDARRLALESGVRVVPQWPADDSDHVDLRFEAIVP